MYNLLKSGMLIILMTLLMIFIGGAVGGRDGALIFFAISMVFNVFSYLFSDKIVIAMYRAK
ncbi:MAG TPA: protease HtpX, partial [bacterium]|nr:protease HtpX [bacterium]